MIDLSVIAPLLGVVLGSMLSGVGEMFKQRAEQKRVVSLALADLLEIRHELMAAERVLRNLETRIENPTDFLPALAARMHSFTNVTGELHQRYDQCVTLVAGFDPFLGYKLRSKNNIPRLLGQLRTTGMAEGVDLATLFEFEILIRKAIRPTLDKAIEELASHHSRRTVRLIRNHINKSDEIPTEAKEFFDELTTRARQQ